MEELNKNDKRLLELCSSSRKSVNQLSREIGISASNISSRITKLEGLGLVVVDRQEKLGKKTTIRTKASIKVNKYIKKILEQIKEKGEVTFNEYALLPGYTPNLIEDPDRSDIFMANSYVSLSPLVERIYRLSEEGLKFLKKKQK